MGITRLGVSRPLANQGTLISTFAASHLVSVVCANLAPTSTPALKIAVYVVPSGVVSESGYAYICSNLTVPLGSSFETFRFAVNQGDTLYVRATTDNANFSVYGLLQDDVVGQGDVQQTFTNKTIRGINNTLYVDIGTTAARRESAEVGYVRYNTEYNQLEVKTPAGWRFLAVE
ncbi:hypothetical protein [Actinomycetia phage DSL-LC01]|nr:hypothetical protein [Actinomycetia phage DSL-LC01]